MTKPSEFPDTKIHAWDEYETLEQAITRLWESRGLKVLRIEVRIGKTEFEWKIRASHTEQGESG